MVALELQTSKRLLLVGGTLAGCMLLAIAGFGKAGRKGRPAALLQQRLQHWGGVGSENYHTSKWDDTGFNSAYHPRDSSSADGDSMEPAWWRQGPGANSEYTGHAMDGELYNPPDQKIFKPFFMKQGSTRTAQLYDVDGPSPRDLPMAAWAKGGKGTTAWMLAKHEHASRKAIKYAAPVQPVQVLHSRRAFPPPVHAFDPDGPSPYDAPKAAWAASGKGTTAWMLKNEGPLLAQEQGAQNKFAAQSVAAAQAHEVPRSRAVSAHEGHKAQAQRPGVAGKHAVQTQGAMLHRHPASQHQEIQGKLAVLQVGAAPAHVVGHHEKAQAVQQQHRVLQAHATHEEIKTQGAHQQHKAPARAPSHKPAGMVTPVSIHLK